VEQLKQNAVVVERLGEPLRPGWPSRLRFQENEEAGWVCLSFLITGAHLITGAQRTGDVVVESERGMAGSAWQLRHLQVKVDGDPQAIQVIEGESRCEKEESDGEALPLQPEGDI
jgi:hypothetical protein